MKHASGEKPGFFLLEFCAEFCVFHTQAESSLCVKFILGSNSNWEFCLSGPPAQLDGTNPGFFPANAGA